MEYKVTTGITKDHADTHETLTIFESADIKSIVLESDGQDYLRKLLNGDQAIAYEGEEINKLNEEAKLSDIDVIQFCCEFALKHKMNLYFEKV